jgi:arylsulfatase A-like enzyme
VVEHAISYLESRDPEEEKPFFLYVSLGLPHPPYGCDAPFYGMTDRQALPPRRPDLSQTQGKPGMLHGIHDKQGLQKWSEEQWNELRGTYLDMTAKFDSLFGRFKEALKKSGEDSNTSIFVFSDHGDYTGDYGIAEKVQNCFDDPVCNIPLIVRPAASMACQPQVSDALVELTDLSATVADLAGIPLDYTQFGKSLVPVLTGARDTHRDAVFCEGGRIYGETQCMELGHGPESQYWPRLSTQASENGEHTKAVMLRTDKLKYVNRLYEKDELYDLEKDPMELHNVIDDPDYAQAVIHCQQRMLYHMIETGDFVPNRRDPR